MSKSKKSTAEVIAEVNLNRDAALASANWAHRRTNDMSIINAISESNVIVIPEPEVIPPLEQIAAEVEEYIAELEASGIHEPEVISEVKAPEVKAEDAKVDITTLIASMPATFTPALLDKLFKLNDGGKTVRRHLRKHFAEVMAHNHKEKWEFSTAMDRNIIQYFANRYSSDMSILAKKVS